MNVYGWSLQNNAVNWYRIREPMRGLKHLGHETKVGPRLDGEVIAWADVVVTSVHAEEIPSQGWQTLARMPDQYRPFMVYDIDDDVWNFDETLSQAEYWDNDTRLLRVQNDIAVADLVTTPSPVLAKHLLALNRNVAVLPNTVPAYLTEMPVVTLGMFTAGYQGGDTHRHDVQMIGSDILQFLTRAPNRRVHIWGAPSYDGPMSHRVQCTPWQKSVKQYYASLQMSVGLAPLVANPFNDAKSAIKALEYAAIGVPSIVSNRPTYRGWVEDGRTGFLIKRHDSWVDRLEYLVANPFSARTMGEAARTFARQWTTEACAWRWQEAYEKGMRG